jgi:hypothetical protein
MVSSKYRTAILHEAEVYKSLQGFLDKKDIIDFNDRETFPDKELSDIAKSSVLSI